MSTLFFFLTSLVIMSRSNSSLKTVSKLFSMLFLTTTKFALKTFFCALSNFSSVVLALAAITQKYNYCFIKNLHDYLYLVVFLIHSSFYLNEEHITYYNVFKYSSYLQVSFLIHAIVVFLIATKLNIHVYIITTYPFLFQCLQLLQYIQVL